MENIERKEIREAISSCDRVLDQIFIAQEQLKGAKNWGLFDMFGGGFLTSVVKHNKIRQAQTAMSDITRELKVLQRELHDVSDTMEVRMKTTDLDMFLDVFFDNIFSDWNTQSKIKAALKDLDELEGDVLRLRETLNALYAAKR